MATVQNFRSAFNGFNREDVVRYIEYTNNKHTSQINQLKTELQNQREELLILRQKQQEPGLEQELAEARAALEQEKSDRAELQQELSALREELVRLQAAAEQAQVEEELEAYRRAERAERMAGERVARLYEQANGALAEVTVRTDETSARIGEAADRVAAQLAELQAALADGKETMKDAAAAMYAIRPAETED